MGRSPPTAPPADLKRVIIGRRSWSRPADSRPECELACRSSLCRIDGNLGAVGHEYMVSKHRGGVRRRPGSGSPEEREADEVCITSARADGRPGQHRSTAGNVFPETSRRTPGQSAGAVRSIRLACLRGRRQRSGLPRFRFSGAKPPPVLHATLLGDRLGRLESTGRYPAGRPPLTARYGETYTY